MIDDAAVRMIKLGPDLMVPLDMLPHDLRRRWDVAQSKAANGANQKTVIANLVAEIHGVLGPDMLIRAAQRAPQSWHLGQAKDAGPLATAGRR
jgi:hypothetical protein